MCHEYVQKIMSKVYKHVSQLYFVFLDFIGVEIVNSKIILY